MSAKAGCFLIPPDANFHELRVFGEDKEVFTKRWSQRLSRPFHGSGATWRIWLYLQSLDSRRILLSCWLVLDP